jgi:hypothetical protein
LLIFKNGQESAWLLILLAKKSPKLLWQPTCAPSEWDASTFLTPPSRPEQRERPELDGAAKICKKPVTHFIAHQDI